MASPLSALLNRAVAADGAAREAAFEELLRLMMIYVRAAMGPKLRSHRESVDICQSVARSFVEDFDTGKLKFESEAELAGYLKAIVRSKLVDVARVDGAAKRGGAEGVAGAGPIPLGPLDSTSPGIEAAAATPSPSVSLQQDQLMTDALGVLSEDDQTLLRLRAGGRSWEEISRTLSVPEAALRQRYSRLAKRVQDAIDGPE